jgi:TPR repeat protein
VTIACLVALMMPGFLFLTLLTRAQMGDVPAQAICGTMMVQTSDFRTYGMRLLERAANAGDVDAMNNLAWCYATNRWSGWRNGPEAVRLAEEACALTAYENPNLLDTLAAAYAEQGQYERAVAIERCAVDRLTPQYAESQVDRATIESDYQKLLRHEKIRNF